MKQTSGTSLPTRPQLFFVEEAGVKGAQRSKQSRAHVARVNRQRQKLKHQAGAGAQAGTGSSSNSSSGTSTPTTAASSRKKSNSSQNSKDDVDTAEGASDVSMTLARRYHASAVVSKTVAPVFGGVTINAFDQRQSTDAADMATYCFVIQGNIMDSWLNPRHKPTWWASKPKFESIWNPESYMQRLESALSGMTSDVEGSHFAYAVPGGLPAGMLRTFQRLAALDKLLDDFSNRVVSRTEEFAVSQLATATQHELLSIPPWDEVHTDQRQDFLMASYEACRIACLIYSLSVVLPVKTTDPWLEKLLKQLRQLLEVSVTDLWTEQGTLLLIWTLFVGGMSAFSTSHCSFFVNYLRTVLQTDSRTSWPGVKSVLEGFLWRDAACGSGAAILWQALQLD
ncbi:hypothetical protein HII31_09835 [Pseudocercospora fuligena]|uniref:Uncharacterized protein n=1 Tax=Pseudocercospora fuligena TaxID=685502 RepID=A0A8H6RE19_9PEZI|nr:hypothetical protein HII31_09835 [Pseudocercospora fuligena]